MYSIYETARLTKRVMLSNLSAKKGESMTTMISGQHGIGKSQVVNEIAEAFGGFCITLEASMLSEGEITGLPIASKNEYGGHEVIFAPHPTIAAIMRVEKEYYEKAKSVGFLNGSVGVNNDGNTFIKFTDHETKKDKIKVINPADTIDRLVAGDNNFYKFGEDLDFETKFKLIESGEIRPCILFIDELNRTDSQTMKELMNIVLNKVVNGYKLPWWVFVCSAINPADADSAYATNEMDPAQLDRFLKLKTGAKLDEWVDYSLACKKNIELVQAVAISDAALCGKKNASLEDKTEMNPSPRSWSMIANYMDHMEFFNDSRFFSADEKKTLQEDFQNIVYSKVGPECGRMVINALKNKERMVKASEILNGDEAEINPKVLEKLNSQKAIERKITAESVIRFLAEEYGRFEGYSKNNDMKIKNKFVNFTKQLNQYTNCIDSATKIVFLKKIANEKLENGKSLFYLVAKFFAKDSIAAIQKFYNDQNDINGEN